MARPITKDGKTTSVYLSKKALKLLQKVKEEQNKGTSEIIEKLIQEAYNVL